MHTLLTWWWRRVLGLLCIVACGYAPVSVAAWVDEGQIPEGAALVYVIRGDAGSIDQVPVYLDGRYVEALQADSYLELAITPGPHEISTPGAKPASLTVEATTGNRYYVKQSLEADGTWHFAVLSDAMGEPLLTRSRALRGGVFVFDEVLAAGEPTTPSEASAGRRGTVINPDIAKASSQISLGVGALHQDYREFNDGLVPVLPSILDSETGRIDSLRLAYNGLFSRIYVQVNLNYSTGDTDYVGYLQAPGPVYTPFTTSTRNTIYDLIERVGYTFNAGETVAVVPYVEAGEFYWSREIGKTTVYYGGAEIYSHLSLGLGAKLLFSPVRKLVLEVGAGGGYVLLGDMTTQGYHYTLGEKPYLSGYASADYRFDESWHLKLSADYRKWEYGQSDIVAGAIEPHSEITQTQYLLSLGYTF